MLVTLLVIYVEDKKSIIDNKDSGRFKRSMVQTIITL